MVAFSIRAWLPLVLVAAGCATASPHPAGSAGELHRLDGTVAEWDSLRSTGGPTVVVFATTWCEICRKERPSVEAWARAHRPTPTLYIFSGGELGADLAQIRAMNLDTSVLTVVVDARGQLADRFGVEATPTVMVLGSQGQVLSTRHRFDPADLP